MSKSNILVGLFVFVLISATFAEPAEVTEDEGVIVLTEDNFQQVIDQYEHVLVKFYAPWCGHCKTMAPAFAEAAAHFKSTPNVRIAKLDATIHKDVSSKFEVKGFPTLKFFQNGKAVEYQGGRDKDQIIQWVAKKTQPPTSAVNTVEEVEALATANKVVVVFFGEAQGQEFTIFEGLARAFDDVTFVTTSSSDVQTHYSPKGQVLLLKQFDEKRSEFEGTFELKELEGFVSANKIPLVSEFSQDIAQEVFANNKAAVFLFLGEDETSKAAQSALEAVAKTMKGKVIFSYAQVKDGFGKRLGDYIGVTEAQVPTVRLVQNQDDAPQKYTLQGDISAESITQLVNDFTEGKLQPTLKSEEIPADNNGPVSVIVGKNFEAIVLDSTKDVLIEFYAPWCGHCKTLAPIFDELGEKMKVHSSVVIAKCDATANEVAGLGIKGFPTIRYFPANNKALPGVEYNGGRTLVDFEKYLEENKTVQWEAAAEKTDL